MRSRSGACPAAGAGEAPAWPCPCPAEGERLAAAAPSLGARASILWRAPRRLLVVSALPAPATAFSLRRLGQERQERESGTAGATHQPANSWGYQPANSWGHQPQPLSGGSLQGFAVHQDSARTVPVPGVTSSLSSSRCCLLSLSP